MVQMKHDEEMRPMHGMCGTLDAELEVRRTIERAELTAFLCLLRRAISLAMVHVDKKGIIDGLWRGEMRCIGPRAKDADLWILIWEEVPQSSSRKRTGGKSNTSKHVAPIRKCKKMPLFQKFITEGHEKADELAQEGAWLDGGEIWRR